MIKKQRILSVFLILMLCLAMVFSAGCRKEPVDATQPSQQVTTESTSITEASEPSPTPEPEKADRFEQIFDTSGDEGKLTARFLKIVSTDVDSKGKHVKSGDSSILVSPDGLVMVIDAGAPSCGKQVAEYLKAMGVDKVDIFVASHMHIDHIGGFPALANEIEIGHVYISRVEYPTSSHYKRFISAIETHNIPVRYLAEGDEFDFGEKVHVTVYNPPAEFTYPEDFASNNTEFLNNMSLMLRFRYDKSTMLFAGDLYKPAEDRILAAYGDAIQSDIAKGNHHGADTSNILDWVTTVKPRITVMIHDGVASDLVYRRYKWKESTVFITSVDGCVKVSTDGTGEYSWVTQFDRQSGILD